MRTGILFNIKGKEDKTMNGTERQKLWAETIETFRNLGEALQKSLGCFYNSYLSEGAIYGKTEEGFTEWLDELGEDE